MKRIFHLKKVIQTKTPFSQHFKIVETDYAEKTMRRFSLGLNRKPSGNLIVADCFDKHIYRRFIFLFGCVCNFKNKISAGGCRAVIAR
jgi:hypothetical protein